MSSGSCIGLRAVAGSAGGVSARTTSAAWVADAHGAGVAMVVMRCFRGRSGCWMVGVCSG